MKVGIVGLPNVGKSTVFNSLTRAGAEAQNYPFTTIDPNLGVATIPDERLVAVAGVIGSKRVVPATVDFVDIAGLVRGAALGRGWETSSSGTSESATLLRTSSAASRTRTSYTSTPVWIPGATSRPSTPNCCSLISRPSSGGWKGSGGPPRAATPDSRPRRPSWNGYATISLMEVPRVSTRRRRHLPRP